MHNADLTLWPFEGGFTKKLKKKKKITDFGMFTCKCFEEHRWEAILCSFITRQLTFPRLLNPSLPPTQSVKILGSISLPGKFGEF